MSPAPLSERIVSYSSEAVRAADEAADDISIYFGDWPLVLEWLKREISDPIARAKGLNNATAFAAIFAVGWLAEYLLWRILAGYLAWHLPIQAARSARASARSRRSDRSGQGRPEGRLLRGT